MSADLLRRAAAVLRAFPAVSHNERWCKNYVHGAIRHVERNVEEENFNLCKDHPDGCGHFDRYDGKYVATMDPPVALALAAVLDSAAENEDQMEAFDDLNDEGESLVLRGALLKLARAILREES